MFVLSQRRIFEKGFEDSGITEIFWERIPEFGHGTEPSGPPQQPFWFWGLKTGQCLITVDNIAIAMSYLRFKGASLKPFHVLTKVFYNAISEFFVWVATVGLEPHPPLPCSYQ